MTKSKLSIGCVFTPNKWARFAIEQYGIFETWLNGASVFDPTMGEGNLLEELVHYGLEKGFAVENLPCHLLFGVELNTEIYNTAVEKFRKLMGKGFCKENFINGDVLFFDFEKKFDIIFGNPPWLSFAALPNAYKEKIKPLFLKYGLAKRGRTLLLGQAQINIAALVMHHVLQTCVVDNGRMVLFMPLNVLLRSGAHSQPISTQRNNLGFCIDEIRSLAKTDAFRGVNTAFGIVNLHLGEETPFPIPFYEFVSKERGWAKKFVVPMSDSGPFLVRDNSETPVIFPRIAVPVSSKPRQGINTCGANHIFFFNECHELKNGMCRVSNKHIHATLPQDLLYPLISKNYFTQKNPIPEKWVFLPYHANGKIMTKKELMIYPEVINFLETHQKLLLSRKGKMIRNKIDAGYFWALLGVGPYNFAPFKIVWEAYGRKTFVPMIVTGKWQAGQALQSYMPFQEKKQCLETLKRLQTSRIEEILLSMKTGGTMSWAQPGVMTHFFEYLQHK